MKNNIFITAREARNGARNNLAIFNEVRDIEFSILTAITNGAYSTIINDSPMTQLLGSGGIPGTGQPYFRVWRNLDVGVITTWDQNALRDQMDHVINHFKDLEYCILRKMLAVDSLVFYWELSW